MSSVLSDEWRRLRNAAIDQMVEYRVSSRYYNGIPVGQFVIYKGPVVFATGLEAKQWLHEVHEAYATMRILRKIARND